MDDEKDKKLKVIGGSEKFRKKESLLRTDPAYLVQFIYIHGGMEQFWVYSINIEKTPDGKKIEKLEYENVSPGFGVVFVNQEDITSISVIMRVDNARESAELIGHNLVED